MPLYIAVIASAALLIFFFLVFVHIQKVRYEKRQRYTVLAVQVAKGDEKAPGPIAAEQLVSTLHGIYGEVGFWDLFTGKRPPRVSFEIANKNKRIRFYIWFPSRYRNLLEGQIYAHYPNVEIMEIDDYTGDFLIEIAEQQKALAR